MSLLVLNKDTYEIEIEPEAIQLAPFQTLYKKDKTRGKKIFRKQVAFIYFYANATSDYMYITNEAERAEKIMVDLGLKEPNEVANIEKELYNAIEFYKSFRSITEELYFGASRAAAFVNDKLKNADELLSMVDERTGKPLYSLKDINAAIKDIPVIMRNLKAAHKEVVLEQFTTEGKKKGSQDFNLFEDGI